MFSFFLLRLAVILVGAFVPAWIREMGQDMESNLTPEV
jgi:hypothetical protein